MSNPNPNKSGLRPPWKPGQPGNPTGKKSPSWRSKLKSLCEDNGHDVQLFKTLIVLGLGDTKSLKGRKPNLKAIEMIAEIVDAYGKRADARAKSKQASQPIQPVDDMPPDKAAYMLQKMMEADAEYEQLQSGISPEPQVVDSEIAGPGCPEESR